MENSRKILKVLEKLYPDPKSELNYSNEFELCISVLLSAQCTDKKVNQVTPGLFKKYPDFKKLSKANVEDVEQLISQVNYYKTKSKHLVALGQLVIREYEGKLPLIHNELVKLPGVGRKTANVVLSELDIEPAIAVDTHVFRVSKRLGLAKGKNVLEVEKELSQKFKSESWKQLHHGLILHGRRICLARNPKCTECELNKLCPSALV